MSRYKINAVENLDAATVAGLAGARNAQTEQGYPAFVWDEVRRKLVYGLGFNDSASPTNSTSFDLWSGQNEIASGATYDGDGQRGRYVLEEDFDTGAITRYDTFAVGQVVPGGINAGYTGTLAAGSAYTPGNYDLPMTGGSGAGAFGYITVDGSGNVTNCTVYQGKGYVVGDVLSAAVPGGSGFTFTLTTVTTTTATMRRFMELENYVFNGMALIDPTSGDLYQHGNSDAGPLPCQIWLLRRSDSFALAISPWFPLRNQNYHMELLGMTSSYVYALEWANQGSSVGGDNYIVATPRGITAAEAAADYKISYFWFLSPQQEQNAAFGSAFSTNNKLYLFTYGGGQTFHLYRLDEPSAATPNNQGTVGGGITDITPWSSTTGPNTHSAAYTYGVGSGSDQGWNLLGAYYLPATNDLALISKLYPLDKTSGTQSDLFFDLTYVHAPDGGSPTFDYHHAFITGFMDINWAPLSSTGNTAPANAAYAVIDAQAINDHRSRSSYAYTADRTKQRFSFTVQKVNPGDTFAPPNYLTGSTAWSTVVVEYDLVFGSAPALVSQTPSAGWDAQLPLNPDYNGAGHIPANAVADLTDSASTAPAVLVTGQYNPNAIYDDVSNRYRFNGQTDDQWYTSSAFTPRRVSASPTDPSPPFLDLGFGLPLSTQAQVF